MTLFKSLITITAAMFFPVSLAAQDILIKKYSSDNRLMNKVVTVGVLENGMVIHAWEWNETAKALDERYGASKEENGYMSAGFIAQDIQAIYPEAVLADNQGYLYIDVPALADQDELIAKMVMEGTANLIAGNRLADEILNCYFDDFDC